MVRSVGPSLTPPAARIGTERLPDSRISPVPSVPFVDRKKVVAEAGADDPPAFVTLSVTEIVAPAAPPDGTLNDNTSRSGPMEISRDRVLFVSLLSYRASGSSALART